MSPGVDAANDVVLHLAEEHVAGGVEADLIRLVERGGEGRATVARVALLAAAGGGRDRARLQVEAADAVVADLAEVEGTVGSDRQAVGVVDLGFRAGTAVARESGDT